MGVVLYSCSFAVIFLMILSQVTGRRDAGGTEGLAHIPPLSRVISFFRPLWRGVARFGFPCSARRTVSVGQDPSGVAVAQRRILRRVFVRRVMICRMIALAAGLK